MTVSMNTEQKSEEKYKIFYEEWLCNNDTTSVVFIIGAYSVTYLAMF